MAAIATINVGVNSAPFGGKLAVQPSIGAALSTKFKFVTTDWDDGDNGATLPLAYTFHLLGDSNETLPLDDKSSSRELPTVLGFVSKASTVRRARHWD